MQDPTKIAVHYWTDSKNNYRGEGDTMPPPPGVRFYGAVAAETFILKLN
jgi:hypothetical protein